jgi:prevent-host-death family protein
MEDAMDVSITEAKDRLTELIRTVEKGENVVITRHGKPVAQLSPPPPPQKRRVRWGTMRGRIHMKPGWDRPLTVDEFLSGDF